MLYSLPYFKGSFLYAGSVSLYAVREITINLFEIPSGMVADTFGRKRSLVFSFLAYIFSFLLFYTAEVFGLFLIAFILYGTGDAFRSGTHKGMIMDYLRRRGWSGEKISYYGHTRAWSQRGSAVSALIAGSILFFRGNYSQVFLFSTVPYALNLLLVLSYPRELGPVRRSEEKRFYAIKRTYKAFIASMRDIRVFTLINHTALHSAYMRAVKDYIQPFMLHVAILAPLLPGVSREQQNGLTIGLFYFLIYILTAFASQHANAFLTKKKTLIISVTLFSGLGFGVLCGVFAQFSLWSAALLAFLMIYIVENIRKPILTGFVADRVKGEYLTSVLSAQSLLKTMMTAVIALLTGIFADLFGIGISLLVVSSLLIGGVLILYAGAALLSQKKNGKSA
ncbi:MAG: MFS transporter [Candidatus Marinimicrobia bacterium]|nr:MFS transporter [Candidatus Neomarinimicrobiota bacterium]